MGRGRPPRLSSPPRGKTRRSPSLAAWTPGPSHIRIAEHKRGADFVEFLKLLFRQYAGRHIFLFVDNCSIHDSKLVRRFLADHQDRITLIWNATYCPELNLIERYWGYLKAGATNNYLFESVDALRQAVREAVSLVN